LLQPHGLPTDLAEETLDPNDWSEAGRFSHQVVDDAIDHLRDVRNRPVWQEMPPDVQAVFGTSLPRSPGDLSEIYRDIRETVLAYPMGNIHPRFWAWYMGASNYTGAIGDFIAAVQGSNALGGSHAGALLNRQVVVAIH
jgi:aromatic-L-amino-acid/L-tryptophan decarboxylase